MPDKHTTDNSVIVEYCYYINVKYIYIYFFLSCIYQFTLADKPRANFTTTPQVNYDEK